MNNSTQTLKLNSARAVYNSTGLRTIKLYGVLGTKFGRIHKLAVSSPLEAVRALSVLYPEFKKFLLESRSRGMGFSVFLGKTNLNESELTLRAGNSDIRIAPIIMGAKRGGLFQILTGAALIGLSIVFPGSTPFTTTLSNATLASGISFALGGVIQLLSPQPKGAKSKDDIKASDVFSGVVNTVAQGNPVPVLYGELIVGSAVISAGILTEDIIIPTPIGTGPGIGPGGGGGGSGGLNEF